MWLHNQCMPREALNHETSLIALQQRQETYPHLLNKKAGLAGRRCTFVRTHQPDASVTSQRDRFNFNLKSEM
jgi:hypothetical protein